MSDHEILDKVFWDLNLRLVKHKVLAQEHTVFVDDHLMELDISYRWINTFPTDSFKELRHLQYLNLSGNEHKHLPEPIFNKLHDLRILKMRYMNLENLPNKIFDKLENLEELHLQSNQLQEVPEGIFDSLSNLKTLHLSGNGITNLPNGVFQNLKDLENLYLDRNSISEINEETFANLINLEFVNLAHNQLTKIDVGSFKNTFKLKYLYLNDNKLVDLYGIFGSLIQLEELYLDGNQLEQIPSDIWKIKYFQGIHLENNPFNYEDQQLMTLPSAELQRQLMGRDQINIVILYHGQDHENFRIIDFMSYMLRREEIGKVSIVSHIDNWAKIAHIFESVQLVFMITTSSSLKDRVTVKQHIDNIKALDIPIIPLKAPDLEWNQLQIFDIDPTYGMDYLIDEFDLFTQSIYGQLREFKRWFNLFDKFRGRIATTKWFVEQAIMTFLSKPIFNDTIEHHVDKIEALIRDLQFDRTKSDEFLLNFVDLVKEELNRETN